MIDTITYLAIITLIVDIGAILSFTIYLDSSFTTKIGMLVVSIALGFTICFVVYMLFGGGANDMISILPINKTAFYQSEFAKNSVMFNGK